MDIQNVAKEQFRIRYFLLLTLKLGFNLFRAPELGIWGLEMNAGVVGEARRATGFINPTSNFSEMGNARFWQRVPGGKKGGYLTSAEVVNVCARAAAMQIARRVEYERVGLVGEGPGSGELQMRAESRRKSYEGLARSIPDLEEISPPAK